MFSNNFKLCIILAIISLSCSSNNKEELKYLPGFNFEIDTDNQNNVNYTNTSTGEYLYIEWDYGNGEKSGAQSNKKFEGTAYYPQKGSYEVTLTVWGPTNKSSDTKTITKTVIITQDDPDFEGEGEGDLLWSDEFDGTSVNLNNWTFETGSNGWGNNELQNYTNGDNVQVRNGKLIIAAKKLNDNKAVGSYTSTRMVSLGKKEFTYGRIEIKAKLPAGKGIWPAIWMLGANINTVSWPACGEIDIMEYVGYQPNVIHATVHTSAGSGGNGNGSSKALETAEDEFHVYGLIWDKSSLTFYTDTPENVTHVYAPSVKNASNWPFDKPHFFILNVAVGGDWGGAQGIDNTIFPQTMEVDYVRVYEL